MAKNRSDSSNSGKKRGRRRSRRENSQIEPISWKIKPSSCHRCIPATTEAAATGYAAPRPGKLHSVVLLAAAETAVFVTARAAFIGRFPCRSTISCSTNIQRHFAFSSRHSSWRTVSTYTGHIRTWARSGRPESVSTHLRCAGASGILIITIIKIHKWIYI